MTFRIRFFLVAGAWIAVVAALVVGLPTFLSDRLPSPVASHWGPSGVPDDSLPLGGVLAIALVLWGLIAAGCLGLALHGSTLRSRQPRALLVATLAWGGCFVVGMTALTVWANLDASDWTTARPVSWQVLVTIGAALLLGWLGWRVGRRGPDEPPPGRTDRPHPFLAVQPGERVVWFSSAVNAGLVGTAAALLGTAGILAGLMLLGLPPWLWVVVATTGATGLAGTLVTSVRARVTDKGLVIAFGPLRWPRIRVALDRIEDAWVEDRMPRQVGGWGYRGLPGRATIMIRGGACLVIRYRSGGTLGLSIDDAERGAALLNGLLGVRAT